MKEYLYFKIEFIYKYIFFCFIICMFKVKYRRDGENEKKKIFINIFDVIREM